ncbi:MAG: esterase [Planctomycetia bacterium]|nr:esterase [Planctomycetia bacterium]
MAAATGTWSEVQVGGHSCDIYEPPALNPHGYVVLYLHGVHLARLTENEAFRKEFDRYGLPVVGPMTARSWWTNKICREFDPQLTAERHLLDNIFPYVCERWGSGPGRVALLGTSMGGQGALRFAFKHPAKFPIVAAISPAIDYQIRYYDEEEGGTLAEMYSDPEAVRQDTATLHVHPLNWPRNTWFSSDPVDYRWHESSERLHMKLSSLGIMHEVDLETSAGGHSWKYYDHMAPRAMQFIAERLDQERRRV